MGEHREKQQMDFIANCYSFCYYFNGSCTSTNDVSTRPNAGGFVNIPKGQ